MPKSKKKSETFADSTKLNAKGESRFVCKPLDSFNEILLFLENPPPWRNLCNELTPHSNFLIRNIDVHRPPDVHTPGSFCHYDPEKDDVQRHEAKTLPKTLVCHDMANGYHDDCMIDGTSNSDAYTFYNWAGIDIFCYFSHHLITIPPVGWINVGHAHGVKVIGTIITEWAEGTTFWDNVLASEVKYQDMASALVAIAKTLKFDGYLLNIENKISQPEVLLLFVRYFHRMLHAELPHATLLWYDSVTITGQLSWQNKLNDKNKAFFDACDGLFTNYSWVTEDVPNSALVASARLTDLYIGIDVWGRNFHGGGQFNTQEAIKIVHAAGCSIALFAPAWTHEALSLDSHTHNKVALGDALDSHAVWLLRDRAFWGSIWPFLNTRVPTHIPFATSFCRGQGRKRCLYGEVLCSSPWYNLRHQQYQPNSAHGPHGYMLLAVENLAKVKNEVQCKDKKGIIRIRDSFLQSRADLHAVIREPTATGTVQNTLQLQPSCSTRDRPKYGFVVEAIRSMFKPKQMKKLEAPEPATEEPQEIDKDFITQPSVSLHLDRQPPPRYGLVLVPNERACLELHAGDSFSGGACLMVHPSDGLCTEHRVTRLFHCDFPCQEALIFCVVTKPVRDYPDQTLNVKLRMRNAADEDLTVVLTGRPLDMRSELGGASRGTCHVYPLALQREDVLRDLRTYLLLTQPGFYVPIDNQFGWVVRYYEINVPGSRITSVNLCTGAPTGPILLGHLAIWKKTQDKSWMTGFESYVTQPVVKDSLKSIALAQPQRIPAPAVQPQSIPAPAVQPQSIPAPAVQPQSIPAPAVQPQRIPPPAVQPQSIPAPAVQPQSIPAPAVQPQRIPPPAVQPQRISVPHMQSQRIPPPAVQPQSIPAPAVQPQRISVPHMQSQRIPPPAVQPQSIPAPAVQPQSIPAPSPSVQSQSVPAPAVYPQKTPPVRQKWYRDKCVAQ